MGNAQQIIIGADVVPTASNVDCFIEGDSKSIIGTGLIDFLGNSSYLICNLETPLCDHKSPIEKVGPNFASPTSAANGLKSIKINLVSLANNHINDQGENGIIETCKALSDAGIPYLGVGVSSNEAGKPHFFEFCGKRVGVYACAENEFSAAKNDFSYGANTFDPFISFDHISKMREECDFVIVLYHGGKEYYRYPSPYIQKVCRKIVDKGADLVICQHSHCIGCKEVYEGATIVYGQGNFIFNKKSDEFWDTSLLIRLNSSLEVDYVPILRTEKGTRLADNSEAAVIMEQFDDRSRRICIPGVIDEEYSKFAKQYLNKYIVVLNGKKSIVFALVNKLFNNAIGKMIIRFFYPKRQKLLIKNYIECESHRELLLKGINDAISDSDEC